MSREVKYILTVDSKTGTANIGKFGQSATNTTKNLKNQGQALDNLSSKYTSFGNVAMKVGGIVAAAMSVTAIKGFITESLKLYSIQEKAEKNLAIAMKNANTYTQIAHAGILKYASALQQVSTYGDEVILQMMANLQTYGMTTRELKAATQATLDLATAKQIDLRAASELVGKAFVGETGTLSRYGIVLEKGIEKSKKFQAVLDLIQQRFGGSATAELETYGGRVAHLTNKWGDLKEKIGEGLVPTVDKLVDSLSRGIDMFYEFNDQMTTAADSMQGTFDLFNELAGLPGMPDMGAGRPTGGGNSILELMRGGGGWTQGGDAAAEEAAIVAAEKKRLELEAQRELENEYLLLELESYAWKESEKQRMKAETVEAEAAAILQLMDYEMAIAEQEIALEKKKADINRAMKAKMLNDAKFFFQVMGQQSELAFRAFQAISISEATIETIKSTVAAWNWGWTYGGPAAPAVATAAAATALAAGMARVYQIASMDPGSTATASGSFSSSSISTTSDDGQTDLATTTTEEKGSFTIYVQGDVLADPYYIELLAEKISDAVEDRSVRLVASYSKEAEAMA